VSVLLIPLTAWIAFSWGFGTNAIKAGMFALIFALTSPVIFMAAMGLSFFGPELAVGAVSLILTAETTPPGTWTTFQAGGGASGSNDPSLLMHSRIYANPEVLLTVEGWIALQLKKGF
jgi:hypothetical protein